MTRARDLSNLIGSGNYTSTTFTATAGQTVFTIAHTQGFIQVFMNGLLLDETTDYTSNGTAVTLTDAATAGDELEVVKYNTFSVGDAITQTDADTRYVNASGGTMTGNLGIGTSSPSRQLTVSNAGAALLLLESSGDDNSQLLFGDSASDTVGKVLYRHTSDQMSFQTNGAERMHIDSSGRVTMPYQPAFAVHNTEIGNAYTGSDLVHWSTVKINRGGHWNSSNGRFTAPVSGVYQFSWWVQEETYYGNWGGSINAGFYVNGSQYTSFGQGSIADPASETWFYMSALIDLNQNDYVTIRFACNDSTPSFEGGQGQFNGYLIG